MLVLSQKSTAQDSTSSSTLTLGRVTLQKEYTQSITIKGTDLERMPFASLSEALQAWSLGYLSTDNNIIFAVDGVIINDVNVYSKYDIEEVVLVQNAVSTLNGATTSQVLALVKTRRRGLGSSGLTVAGQSYQVRADRKQHPNLPTDATSTINYFHTYHVGGYYNSRSVQFNVSANYLRDVSPFLASPGVQVIKPMSNDRLGINGWLQAQLGRAHELTFRINATPQFGGFEERIDRTNPVWNYFNTRKDRISIVNPSLGLRSSLAKGLTNEFTVVYATGTGKVDVETEQKGAAISYYKGHSTTKANQWVVMDNVTYHAPLNKDWSLNPSLSLFYRHVQHEITSSSSTQAPGGGLGGGGSLSSSTTKQKGAIFLLTPSINLYYRKSFNLQAGVQTNLSKTNGAQINKVLPFATTSIDVVKLFRPQGTTSLQLFGSIGQADNLGDYRLNLETTVYIPTFGYLTYLPAIAPFQRKQSLWNWHTGTRLGLWNGRLTANYAYESRSYVGILFLSGPQGPLVTFEELLSQSHNLNLQWQVMNNQSLNWRTSVSAVATQHQVKGLQPTTPTPPNPAISLDNKSTWTGGWANRVIAFQRLTAGIDVLYAFNQPNYVLGLDMERKDVVSLANVYVGYVFSLKGASTLECYANSRNPAQDKDLNNIASYKYYGLGFKATL